MLTRLLMAVRVSLLVALVVETLNVVLGGGLGLLAGYFGGWVDMLISRAADMLFAFPGLLLAILVSAVFGSDGARAVWRDGPPAAGGRVAQPGLLAADGAPGAQRDALAQGARFYRGLARLGASRAWLSSCATCCPTWPG